MLTHDGAMVHASIAMSEIQALYYAGQQVLGLTLIATGDELREAIESALSVYGGEPGRINVEGLSMLLGPALLWLPALPFTRLPPMP